ncbi:MAG: sigma-70 family RNA polymerase sigma factor, partial [Candidatus Delongbacteria bacterium]|nr:sigma-70 family RNA polymerase sigma factor [Candidatus Delongbacteria bacterium]
EEIANVLETTELEVTDTLKIPGKHISIDAEFNTGEDNRLLDVLKEDKQPSPDNQLFEDSLREEIDIALKSLSDREKEVIILYFGIDQEQALTLEEIGMKFGLTRERVRQIKEKAIRRLRHTSRSKALRAYLG